MKALQRSGDHRDYQRVPRVVTAMARDAVHGVSAPPHSHERAQLLYATEGLMKVKTAFGVWILPPRRALFIPPGVVHQWTSLSRVTMRTIYIEAATAQAFGDSCRVIEVSPLLRELILSLLDEPIEYPLPGRGEHLAMLILSELAAAETVPIAIPWPRDRRLLAVCEAIVDDPGSPRTIEDWAAEAGASARTLIRLFPKETGLHYRQWVQQVHLAEAFGRLARGDSVGEIAAALGYASPSAFSAMFRRILGKTPQHYLNSWRAPLQPA
ncbi:AraC family transcriptional regulator [Duganella violaceipulchra]|uniref:AraC-like DNA-binding protein/mannose-6-phosphate isomerase-like protein (Cupin superfamily) n=1 Tax=Duganella violaceipulchra TaxID=2849652 RepID=A0AA41L833_9BURK|nr:helix-turn-helix transcriptional regulator [Duganella violaceicalia]MBV6324972.1 helix-turn-helix transcriptional regulator [Duganella violaceicalia]MCP2009151.1 AraC-like DNA-binding protein/mannose-6-phosphate isomerase-like protein (cupin superfamily) [Duganella violaceicalia]